MALVVVQLIANLTAGQVVVSNNGCGLVRAPLLRYIVVVGSACRTVVVDVLVVIIQVNNSQVVVVTADVFTVIAAKFELAAVADDETVHNLATAAAPTDDAATVLCCSAFDDELCQAVLDEGAVVGHSDNACMSGIAGDCAGHLNVGVAATDGAAAPDCDTGCQLLACANCALHLQVLDKCLHADIAEEGCTLTCLIGGIDGNGVALTVEASLIVQAIPAYHGEVGALVDVGCQHGIGKSITTIHEFGKGFQVCRRTNLIDAAHFGERPCSCADNAKERGQTQIQ